MDSQVQYNNISAALKAKVVWPKDSKGRPVENVVYQTRRKTTMFTLNKDNERSEIDTYPGVSIPNVDTIYDAGADDYVQIAYYKTMRPGTRTEGASPKLIPIEFTAQNWGYITVPYKGGEKLFQFMELTNANADSVNPDKQMSEMGWLFERVKPEASAESLLDTEAEIMRIKAKIFGMSADEMRLLAPLVNVDATQEPNQLQYALLKRAEQEPALVNSRMDGEAAKILADVQEAVRTNTIQYSEDAGGFVWYDNRVLISQIPASAVDKEQAFADYLGSSPDALRLREVVRTATKAKKPKGAAAPAAAPAKKAAPAPAKPAAPAVRKKGVKNPHAKAPAAETSTGTADGENQGDY